MNEKEKIEHQIELATRVAALLKDESSIERFKNFAEELKQKLLSMMRRPQVRVRAYELWEKAGKPTHRVLGWGTEKTKKQKKAARGKNANPLIYPSL
jgi:hypothetical protein